MASQVTNHQCPACTGPLQFNPDTGKLGCEFCGSVFELADIEALYQEKEEKAAEAHAEAEAKKAEQESEWDLSGMSEDWGEDANGMKTYSCPACTAELICDATTAATSCPYCGNPTVVPGQFSGSLKPDYVIPFKLDKDEAIKALKKHYQKRFFLPKTFSATNTLQKVQGVYVPFWLFDGEAEGDVFFKATRSHTKKRGDYEITETKHFNCIRSGSVAFEKVPVDASTKMPDDYMESIEPFDYNELKPFSTAYLPGFLADKYDVSVEASEERADRRCTESLALELQSTVIGYETVSEIKRNVRLNRGKVHYALLPVWLLNTKWNGKDYLFAMNGQSGKFVGDLPMDKKKFWSMFFGLGAGLSAISSLLILLLR